MSSDEPLFSKGGLLTPADETTVWVEAISTCPRGHTQYRINGSDYLEHIVKAGDVGAAYCTHAVVYKPRERDADEQ